MKFLICMIIFVIAIARLQSADYATAREYVVSNLKSLKEADPPNDSWIKATSDKLVALQSSLPVSDAAFKATIQKGINALSEMQTQENDTLVLDLFVLASAFADYYRVHKTTPGFDQNAPLVAAFKAFEYGETDNPLAYFNPVLRSMLFSYRHYYWSFSEPIPERIAKCQIEYLGSAYLRCDADGPDYEFIFAVTANWTGAFAKLKAMPVAARNAALTTLEQALDSGEVVDAATEMTARQHLTEAKAFFGIAP